MSGVSFEFWNIFVESPGSLLYFLLLIIVSQISFLMAVGQRLRQSSENHRTTRYTLATLGIVLMWFVLLVGALVSLLMDIDSTTILPPLEHTANAVTILLAGWAFLTADHDYRSRNSNIAMLSLFALVIVGYIITGTQWANVSNVTDFNLSTYGVTWAFIPLLLSLVGIIFTAVYFRIIVDAPLKLIFFVVLAIGYGITLYQMTQGILIGNFAGIARFTFLIALLILPSVIYRMIIQQFSQTINSIQAQVKEPTSPPSRATTEVAAAQTSQVMPKRIADASPVERQSVQLLKVMGEIFATKSFSDIHKQIVLAVMDELKADVGALLEYNDPNYADINFAYNKLMKREINVGSLNLNYQPTLVNVIERSTQGFLTPDDNPDEVHELFIRLDIDQVGPVYFQPMTRSGELIGILLLAMPYSHRELKDMELELLKGISLIASNLLYINLRMHEEQHEFEERMVQSLLENAQTLETHYEYVVDEETEDLETNLKQARSQITELSEQVKYLKLQLDDERTRLASMLGDTEEGLSISQRIISLNQEHEKLTKERDELLKRLQEAETSLTGATATDNEDLLKQMTQALRQEHAKLLQERDRLQEQLDVLRADDKLIMPENTYQILKRMMDEKSELETERNQLQERLNIILGQLEALGVESGVSGLSQIIGELSRDRSVLETKVQTLEREKASLLHERTKIEGDIAEQKTYESRLGELQTQLKHLATDRESALKQRDKLKAERDEVAAKLDSVKQHRARLLAQSAGLEMELAEAYESQDKVRNQIQDLLNLRREEHTVYEKLVAEKQAIENERDQLLARSEGDRLRLQEVNEGSAASFKAMVEMLTQEREGLEEKLAEVENELVHRDRKLAKLEYLENCQKKHLYQIILIYCLV